jgi:glycogen debranching enzyme
MYSNVASLCVFNGVFHRRPTDSAYLSSVSGKRPEHLAAILFTIRLIMLGLLLFVLMLPYQSLKITGSGTNHLYHFANKKGVFWVNETSRDSRHFLMGYIAHRETIYSDYSVSAAGQKLDRKNAAFELEPHVFRRRFSSGTEEVFMPDTIDAMVFTWTVNNARTIEATFFFQGLTSKAVGKTAVPTVLLLETDKKLHRYVAIASESGFAETRTQNGDITFSVKTSRFNGPLMRANLSIGTGATRQEAIRSAVLALSNEAALKLSKQNRLELLSAHTSFESADENLAKALSWALISFDALNANETKTGLGEGIYAGYPWFQDYWGRDSFIALRALTVSGQGRLARANLESFLKFQVLNDTSASYGKVPNRVRPDESIYNTADATPRFIIEAWRYVQWTGDATFIPAIKNNLTAAIRGTLKYRTDAQGLLVHNDADTWMDAVGPKGPYSPRGNRANDIQALWIDALGSAVQMFKQLPRSADNNLFIQEMEAARQKALASFDTLFVNRTGTGALVYDAVKADGKADAAIRPNQLFCAPLLGTKERSVMLQQTTAMLGTRFGPLSLDPAHEWFHPFHKYEGVYEQDASYHNGIIWLWNTGEWMSQLISANQLSLSAQVTAAYAQAILKGPGLGTLAELADAMPRKPGLSDQFPDAGAFPHISRLDQISLRNESKLPADVPSFSGTFSQAWSLSEYLRNAIEDYAGFHPLEPGVVGILPRIPAAWKVYQAGTVFHNWRLTGRMEFTPKGYVYSLKAEPSRRASTIKLLIQLPGMPKGVERTLTANAETLVFTMDGNSLSAMVNDRMWTPAPGSRSLETMWELPEPLRFADLSQFDHTRKKFKSQTNPD